MKRKCLVTGAAGLIGSHLLPVLQNDFEVFALVQDQKHIPSTVAHDVQIIEGDLSQQNFTDHLPDSMDVIIHLAQSEQFRDFPNGAADVFAVNVSSCFHLLEYGRRAGVQTFVMASSGIVYGDEDSLEDEKLRNHSQDLGFYYTSKLCAEAITDNYQQFMNVVTLRFFFVYGPGQGESMLIPRLVRSVIEGKSICLAGEDGMLFNPIHVRDAVTAIRSSVDLNSSEKINVAGSDVLSLRQVGEYIGEAVGKAPCFDVDAQAKANHLVGRIEKMKRLFNHHPCSFREGIEDYVQFMQLTHQSQIS